MEAYTVFADIYDDFMGNIPYETWSNNIAGLLKEYDITEGIVCELGCGTGKLTELMAKKGYEMIGIDNSEDMLSVARESCREDILYLLQDMRELELYGTVEAVISVCDSMNYLVKDGELEEVLRKVNLYLERDGIFIFDMKTEYCYEKVLGDSVQYEDTEDMALIWENHYDNQSKIHTYDLTMFISYDEEECFTRYRETHYQRAYSVDEVKAAVKAAGMELLKVIDADSMKEPGESSERIYYVVKECFQENKTYVEG